MKTLKEAAEAAVEYHRPDRAGEPFSFKKHREVLKELEEALASDEGQEDASEEYEKTISQLKEQLEKAEAKTKWLDEFIAATKICESIDDCSVDMAAGIVNQWQESIAEVRSLKEKLAEAEQAKQEEEEEESEEESGEEKDEDGEEEKSEDTSKDVDDGWDSDTDKNTEKDEEDVKPKPKGDDRSRPSSDSKDED